MAFNNFPVGYQPYYQPQPQQQVNNGIIWVQGEAGAKSYMVAPNTTVQLWDSENQVIYLKSADASGMPSMKIIDYTIRGSNLPSNGFLADTNKDIYKDELNALKSKLERLEHELYELKKGSADHGESVVQSNAK